MKLFEDILIRAQTRNKEFSIVKNRYYVSATKPK